MQDHDIAADMQYLIRSVGEGEDDLSWDGQTLTHLLAHPGLPRRLRVLAGLDLIDLLGVAGLPLLSAYVPDGLVDSMEELATDQAKNLLLRMTEDSAMVPGLRLEAAAAVQRVQPQSAEWVYAELALADGLSVRQRLEVLGEAVAIANRPAATAAYEILRLMLESDQPLDDSALALALRHVREDPQGLSARRPQSGLA